MAGDTGWKEQRSFRSGKETVDRRTFKVPPEEQRQRALFVTALEPGTRSVEK